MNQRGQLIQVFAFVAALGLTALFITVAEPIIDAMLDILPASVAGDGTTPRLIIFGASLLIILGGIWFLTRPNQQVGFNA